MDTMTVQRPPTETSRRYRTTDLDDGAEITVSVHPDRQWSAHLSLTAAVATFQLGVCMTRDQLIEHRDACNAVLTATEPSA